MNYCKDVRVELWRGSQAERGDRANQVTLYEAGYVVIMEWLRHYEAFQGLFSRLFKVSHYTNKQTLRSLSTSNMPCGHISLWSQLRWMTHDGLW